MDKVAEPIVDSSFRKITLYYDNTKGNIQIKRLENAEDLDEFNDTVDDILR